MTPGMRAMQGIRMPPSHSELLKPRKGVFLPTWMAPLSLVKMTSVLSAAPYERVERALHRPLDPYARSWRGIFRRIDCPAVFLRRRDPGAEDAAPCMAGTGRTASW